MKVILYTTEESTKHLLIYLLTKCKNVHTLDMYKNIAGNNVEWEKAGEMVLFGIGMQEDVVASVEEGEFNVHVCDFIHGREFFKTGECHRVPEFVRQVFLWGDIVTPEFIGVLHERAKSYVEGLVRERYSSKTHKVKKYVFDAQDMYWDLMSSAASRSVNSLFLKGTEKEKLFAYVKEFFTSEMREEYEKYNMPYKCNVLLYGKPGTGKTSTIMAVASYLNMNIGLIPISKGLDDTGLIHAINSAKKNNVRILVLEDVDCLFNERKIHDGARNSLTLSGILNCLDGMYRNEGIMIFMTANNVSFIDEAVLRSNRIDYRLYYDFANKEQIRQCFEFYFPGKQEMFLKFYDMYACKDITISMLQAFFFKHRRDANILEFLSELDDLIAGIKEEEKDSINMYI